MQNKLLVAKNLRKFGKLGTITALALMAAPALAGGDNTFDPITSQIDGWLTGSLGYLIALAAFLVGVYNAFFTQRGVMAIAMPFFLSIIITVGITVIQGGFTAMI